MIPLLIYTLREQTTVRNVNSLFSYQFFDR